MHRQHRRTRTTRASDEHQLFGFSVGRRALHFGRLRPLRNSASTSTLAPFGSFIYLFHWKTNGQMGIMIVFNMFHRLLSRESVTLRENCMANGRELLLMRNNVFSLDFFFTYLPRLDLPFVSRAHYRDPLCTS